MKRHLPGDWRSGAYGANRRAHLWTYRFGGSVKVPACGARLRHDRTGRVPQPMDTDRACYDCLAAAAAGRV